MNTHIRELIFSLAISVYTLLGFAVAGNDIEFLKSTMPTKNTLIIVSADWCLPCRVVHKWIKEDAVMKNILSYYEVQIYDFDKDKDIVKKYGVSSVPFFAIIKNNEIVSQKVGVNNGKNGLELFLRTNKD